MKKGKDYRKTKRACYLGFVTQAIVANFTPLLFMAFHHEYKIPIASLALIPAVFYIIQLITDLLCAKFKNINYRKSIIISGITSATGLMGLAFLPELFPNPLVGILLCVCVYAIGSGLIEVLCSPHYRGLPFPKQGGHDEPAPFLLLLGSRGSDSRLYAFLFPIRIGPLEVSGLPMGIDTALQHHQFRDMPY